MRFRPRCRHPYRRCCPRRCRRPWDRGRHRPNSRFRRERPPGLYCSLNRDWPRCPHRRNCRCWGSGSKGTRTFRRPVPSPCRLPAKVVQVPAVSALPASFPCRAGDDHGPARVAQPRRGIRQDLGWKQPLPLPSSGRRFRRPGHSVRPTAPRRRHCAQAGRYRFRSSTATASGLRRSPRGSPRMAGRTRAIEIASATVSSRVAHAWVVDHGCTSAASSSPSAAAGL
jgi:hypothetical protein